MRRYAYLLAALMLPLSAESILACQSTMLDQDFRKLASTDIENLCDTHRGKVLLIVNTASKCGYTPQYDGLEKLHTKYEQAGFSVLGFPSNDFMGQEPGNEQEIQEFCRLTYGVKFPMYEKTTVKEGNAHPLFKALADTSGTYPTWNFHKYLIGRNGELIAQFSPGTKPADQQLVSAIEKALQE